MKVLVMLLLANTVMGQLVINEYSASNLNSYIDPWGKSEDWIELYNSGTAAMDISGYHVSDNDNRPTKWAFPENTIVDPGGFIVVYCSGRDGIFNNQLHTSFKLTQTKGTEEIVLADPMGQIIESTPMELTLVEHSRCKAEDGQGGFLICPSTTLGFTNDNVDKFEMYTATPTIDQEAGFYDSTVEVTITNNEPGSILRYTLDGTNPRASSAVYEGPLTVSATTVVKAQSFPTESTMLVGKMDFSTFFVNEDFSVAVFSVAADDLIRLAEGQGELIPVGSLEYFNPDKEREAVAFGSLNRHGQDSWVLDHRSLDWVTRDEMGYTQAVNAQLFRFSDRDEYQKFMFRNSGDDNYPASDMPQHRFSTHIRDEYVQTLALEGDLKLDTRAVERVVVFLNGQYWGLYGMRDRPVDHDYTNEYYNQGKYDLHFLSTWGTTESEYGGQPALDDWVQLRDFIMQNDMSNPENYAVVKDQLQTQSLIDYMLVNLNVVAVDWLNYNTGWWRGLNPEGDHKKWGYILWDLDATFDYYINYTGVPNQDPDALPCDIEEISDSMDDFFGPIDVGINAADCPSVQAPGFPYEADDPIVAQVIEDQNFCCFFWDANCESSYQVIVDEADAVASCPTYMSGSVPHSTTEEAVQQVMQDMPSCCESEWTVECEALYETISSNTTSVYDGEVVNIQGNFGQHEKIFIKLIEESPVFKQEYYSRQADLMNTVFSCENMNETLERMLDVIRPEMPQQIARWGGTLSEWESNVDRLRSFVNDRCEFLGQGMTTCYDLTGPHQLTIMTEPAGVGDDVKLNSLTIESFPWTGDYFGNMENIIEADRKDGDYFFSHWESRAGNVITPSELDREAFLNLSGPDTLVAVYSMEVTSTAEEVALQNSVRMYPNPTSGITTLALTMEEAAYTSISLYNSMGKLVSEISSRQLSSAGQTNVEMDLGSLDLPLGMYMVKINIDENTITKRLTYVR